MLEWEPFMAQDLSPFFDGAGLRGTFEDVLVQNKDARVLKDSAGNVRLLYAFPNTETLLITTNQSTFLEVFGRLTSVSTRR